MKTLILILITVIAITLTSCKKGNITEIKSNVPYSVIQEAEQLFAKDTTLTEVVVNNNLYAYVITKRPITIKYEAYIDYSADICTIIIMALSIIIILFITISRHLNN